MGAAHVDGFAMAWGLHGALRNAQTSKEGNEMISLDLLALVGGSSVLPYLAEAAWDWFSKGRKHSRGATAPD
jgi:hypothetical protein